MTQNSPSSEQQLAGNSPASRDIAFHMHPYTNPAMLGDAGPRITKHRRIGIGMHMKSNIAACR